MSSQTLWSAGWCLGLQVLLAGVAFGAGPVNTKTGAPIEGARSSGTSATLTGSPVSYEQEYSGRFDLAVSRSFGVGIEGSMKQNREEAAGDAVTDVESRRAEGQGAVLLVSAFTGKRPLTGFYGTAGAGFRKEAVKWQVAPNENDQDLDLTLLKSDLKLHHAADLKGPTGHIRAGYRFVVPETPILLGAYVGGRYFQATVTDADAEENKDSSPMTDSEKSRLAKDYEAKVEAAVEVGFAF